MIVCRKCGANPQTTNVVLKRVNAMGVEGIWECSPDCKVRHISSENAILHALEIPAIEKSHEYGNSR